MKTLTHAEAIAKILLLRGDVAISVDLSWCLLDDAALECLKGLPELQDLYLSHTEVSDAGLEHLKGLRQLQTLDLGGTNVTDAGLEHLKDLPLLQTLDLCGAEVTDAGLEHLKDLFQLQTLDLGGAKVTDAGVECLQAFRQLEELGLSGTEVTDAGLEHFRGLPELEKLCLWATGAGLKHLKGLPRLRELDLGGTRVTDAGLEHLKGLRQLQSLGLRDTEVTDAGLEHLKGLTQLRTLDLTLSMVKGPLDPTEWASRGPQVVGLDADPVLDYNAGPGRAQANGQSGPAIREPRQTDGKRLESLGILAGGIAHDINNILAGIMGYADLALLQLPASAPARADIEVIKHSVRRAAGLTQRMLAYSGTGKFIVEAVNVSQIVEDSRKLLAMFLSKTTTITYSLAANLPSIQVDAALICQVVMNLVINASEALGKQGGVIAVSTSVLRCEAQDLASMGRDQDLTEGLHICLAVADTGCGMDEQTVARIFDPFFTTKFTGRGLGLATVQGIVRSLKGTIQVSSEPGNGTTFRVLFPASNLTATPAPSE